MNIYKRWVIVRKVNTLIHRWKAFGLRHTLQNIRKEIYSKTGFVLGNRRRAHQLRSLIKDFASQRLIIILSTVDYHFPYRQRPQHLAKAFSDIGINCIYVSPNGHYDNIIMYQHINEHLLVVDKIPKDFPPCRTISFLILSTDNTLSHELLETLRQIGNIVYDYIDEISEDISLAPIPSTKLALHANLLSDEAITVISSAAQLHQQVAEARSTRFGLVTNGVYMNDFLVERHHNALVSIFENILKRNKPIIGYYGALASWVDYALLHHIARALPHCSIVLIGPKYDNSATQLEGAPSNLYWVPPMPYEVLPKHAIWFDICVIPFVVNDITKSTSPLKLYEYLALGKPVVTTDMPECRGIPCVYTSKDTMTFIDNLQRLLTMAMDEIKVQAQHSAAQFAWSKKARQILEIVDNSYPIGRA